MARLKYTLLFLCLKLEKIYFCQIYIKLCVPKNKKSYESKREVIRERTTTTTKMLKTTKRSENLI